MEYEVEFLGDGGPADAAVTLSGQLTATSFHELTEALGNDPHWRAGITLLVDISGLEVGPISDDDLGELTGPVVARDWDSLPRAVAIIAPDDERFSAAQSYRAHLGGSKSNRQAFRSRAEAVAWLHEQRA